jgi:Flp pilus assembly protein TadB
MPISIPLILAVFLLGFALGALLVAIERRTRIESLKQDFQAQLEAIVQRAGPEASDAVSKTASSEPREKVHADPSRAA